MPKALPCRERLNRARAKLAEAEALREPDGPARTYWVQKVRSRLLAARGDASKAMRAKDASLFDKIDAGLILAAVERDWPTARYK